jgi:hypothetical protein
MGWLKRLLRIESHSYLRSCRRTRVVTKNSRRARSARWRLRSRCASETDLLPEDVDRAHHTDDASAAVRSHCRQYFDVFPRPLRYDV